MRARQSPLTQSQRSTSVNAVRDIDGEMISTRSSRQPKKYLIAMLRASTLRRPAAISAGAKKRKP